MTSASGNDGVVLVTGGAGYIGSHTCVELIQAGKDLVILDNLSNGKSSVISRIEKITGRRFDFIEADVRDSTALDKIFDEVSQYAAGIEPFDDITLIVAKVK